MNKINDMNQEELEKRIIVKWAWSSLFWFVGLSSFFIVLFHICDKHVASFQMPNNVILGTIILCALVVLMFRLHSLISISWNMVANEHKHKLREKAGSNCTYKDIPFLKIRYFKHRRSIIISRTAATFILVYIFIAVIVYDFYFSSEAIFKCSDTPSHLLWGYFIVYALPFCLFGHKYASIQIMELEQTMFLEGDKSPSIKKNAIERILPTGLTFPEQLLSEDLVLKQSISAFVRYCYGKGYFDPYTKKAWEPIDCIILDKNHSPVSAKQLAQAYQDLMSKGTIHSGTYAE